MFITIPGFPNYAFNNETLEVKSLKRKRPVFGGRGVYFTHERILKPNPNGRGYYVFSLYNKAGRKSLKRHLICWIVNTGGRPEKPMCVDHINNIKTDDRFSNLQLLTNKENLNKGLKFLGQWQTSKGIRIYRSGKK